MALACSIGYCRFDSMVPHKQEGNASPSHYWTKVRDKCRMTLQAPRGQLHLVVSPGTTDIIRDFRVLRHLNNSLRSRRWQHHCSSAFERLIARICSVYSDHHWRFHHNHDREATVDKEKVEGVADDTFSILKISGSETFM